MNPQVRLLLFVTCIIPFAAFMMWGVFCMPRFGSSQHPYGDIASKITISNLSINNAVTAVTFDIRGFDTLGEEFILFTAVVGILLLLRLQKEEHENASLPPSRQNGRWFHANYSILYIGKRLLILIVLYGFYIALHTTVSPGGGFQGGVILSSAFLIYMFLYDFHAFERIPIWLFDLLEGAGMAGYLICGSLGWFTGRGFMHNVIPPTAKGTLLSGGLIPVINFSVLVAVFAGFIVLLIEFALQGLLSSRSKGAQ